MRPHEIYQNHILVAFPHLTVMVEVPHHTTAVLCGNLQEIHLVDLLLCRTYLTTIICT